MKEIKNKLKEYRIKAGLKQKDVAKAMGLKHTTKISKWERGKLYPHPMNLFKLARFYNVNVEELFQE